MYLLFTVSTELSLWSVSRTVQCSAGWPWTRRTTSWWRRWRSGDQESICSWKAWRQLNRRNIAIFYCLLSWWVCLKWSSSEIFCYNMSWVWAWAACCPFSWSTTAGSVRRRRQSVLAAQLVRRKCKRLIQSRYRCIPYYPILCPIS